MKQFNQVKEHDDTWVVKRKIKTPLLSSHDDVEKLERAVAGLSGIRHVNIDFKNHLVIVRYDMTVLDYGSILACLNKAGFPVKDSVFSKWKKNWCEFTETNARENAKAPPPSCCNKPPK